MKKPFIFILLIVGLVWSCKENNDVTHTQDLDSASGSILYKSDQSTSGDRQDIAKISGLLNKLVDSGKDPENLIKTAFTIQTNRSFGDSLSVIAANFLLQKATNTIEEFSFNSNLFKSIVYRRMANELQERGVPIDIPLTSFRKVMINIQQKNYHYLFTRLQLQVKQIISKSIASHKVFFYASVILVLVFIGFQIKMRRYFYSTILVLVCAGVFMLYGMAPKSTSIPANSFQNALFDFEIEKEIGASQILNEQHIRIGKLIYMNEKAIGFSYHFSPLNISPVIDDMAKKNQLLLNTTVSFVNNKSEPVGFTAVKGKILNPMIHYHWGGLMLISDQKIEVIPLNKRKGNNPTINFESYFQLNQRINDIHSDAFQVPLLVYNDSLLLNPDNVSPKLRENRFLMKVVTPERQVLYLIADIDYYYPLAYNTMALFNKLKERKYSVQFMSLLDVGANNFFQVCNSDGKINQHFISTLPAEKATNILSVYLLQNSTFSIDL